MRPTSQDAIAENFRLHDILVKGYRGISYIDSDGIEQNPTIRLVSHVVEDNEFLAVNQVTIRSKEVERRFDVVLYVNGLPIVIVELKKAGAEEGGPVRRARPTWDLPARVPDGVPVLRPVGDQRRHHRPLRHAVHPVQPLFAMERRRRRPAHQGSAPSPDDVSLGVELEYLIDGVCNQERFLQLLRNFVAFDAGADGFGKRIAKPHQYFAVTKAVGSTVAAVESNGKAGVVWHTQGSGKSMEMELYAHLVSAAAEAEEPDARRRDRPHGARQPAVRDVQPVAAARRDARQGHDP